MKNMTRSGHRHYRLKPFLHDEANFTKFLGLSGLLLLLLFFIGASSFPLINERFGNLFPKPASEAAECPQSLIPGPGCPSPTPSCNSLLSVQAITFPTRPPCPTEPPPPTATTRPTEPPGVSPTATMAPIATFVCTLKGDVVVDGVVNVFDLGKLMSFYGKSVDTTKPDSVRSDINQDGEIGIFDLGILAAHYGEHGTCPTGTLTPTTTPTVIPTPTATIRPTPTLTPTPTKTPTPSGPTPTWDLTSTLTPIPNEPPLRLAKSASRGDVPPGQLITFTLSLYTNNPTRHAIMVQDPLDAQVDFVAASSNDGSCAMNGTTLVCNVTAQNNYPVTINFNVRVKVGTPYNYRISNRATAVDSRNQSVASNTVTVAVTN